MLNVPTTVKTLFKRDGVLKNFRVHFPNNELPDITNENIVQESVKFTESLCSQDVLKFGLTEASVIEFETVGIGNMYGMDIECGIEIDLSSLSAGEISDIAAGTWDGTYCAVGDSDIGYAYFRIPYGRFRVESCPRDHQAMTHRRVQAFSYSPTDLNDNPFEVDKQNTLNIFGAYSPNMYNFMLENVAYNVSKVMTDEGFTGEAVSTSQYKPSSASSQTDNIHEKEMTVALYGGGTTTIYCYVYYDIGYTNGAGSGSNPYKLETNSLFSADLHGVDYNGILNQLAAALQDLGVDPWNSGFYTSHRELALALLTDLNGMTFLYPGIGYYPKMKSNTGGHTPYQKVDIRQDLNAIYPYIHYYSDSSIESIYECAIIPRGFYFTEPNEGQIARIQIQSANRASFKIWRGTSPSLSIAFATTGNDTIVLGTNKYTGYKYGGEVSMKDMINGYIELIAAFGKISRTGGFELVRLSKSSPISVLPGEYSGFWWDEFDVLPIGSVKYIYTNYDDVETQAVYKFGSGSSVYDMTDNTILKASGKSTEQQARTILSSNFTPHLAPVAFTPIEMTMKGMPWIEAGDYLAVAAEDGTIANSFAMRVEISGIQILTLYIESSSGEIIDSSEGS